MRIILLLIFFVSCGPRQTTDYYINGTIFAPNGSKLTNTEAKICLEITFNSDEVEEHCKQAHTNSKGEFSIYLPLTQGRLQGENIKDYQFYAQYESQIFFANITDEFWDPFAVQDGQQSVNIELSIYLY